jgi:arsenate reductase
MKNILVVCNENSARSIITEALIKFNFKNAINCYSAGLQQEGEVDQNTIKAIKEFGISTKNLYSKTIDSLKDINFDLLICVCDNAKEHIPSYLSNIKLIHHGFENPNGKKFFEYLKTIHNINTTLMPQIKEQLK